MLRPFKLLRRIAFPIAILTALSFGTAQAVSQVSSRDCPYDPPDHLGECSSQEECDDLCDPYNPFMAICDWQGCCGCLFK